jgi:hypothetical protein
VDGSRSGILPYAHKEHETNPYAISSHVIILSIFKWMEVVVVYFHVLTQCMKQIPTHLVHML